MNNKITLPNNNGGSISFVCPNDVTTTNLVNVLDSAYTVDSISDLNDVPAGFLTVFVKDYHSGIEGGGGVFVYDSTKAKSEHNGGTIIDPTAVFPTDWNNQTQLTTWFDSANAGVGAWVRQYSGAVNVKWFGAVSTTEVGYEEFDSYEAMQNALNYADKTVFIPDGIFGLSKKLIQDKSSFTIVGNGKFVSQIKPLSSFDRLTYDCLLEVGTLSTNSHTVKEIGCIATYSSSGNNLSGMAINAAYNVDIIDCKMQSGNYTSRDTAGLLIKSGKHTRIIDCNLHNGSGYGVVINRHSNDLVFVGCSFDETPVAIISTGNILDMAISLCTFGSTIINTSYPTPKDSVVIDCSVGAHGTIKITNNIFFGGTQTNYGVIVDNTERFSISDNSMINFNRFAIVHDGIKDFKVQNNIFSNNGSATTTIDPSLGTRGYTTTAFCTDIYRDSEYLQPCIISGNITSIEDRPMAWMEGSTSSPLTTHATIISNSAFGGAAYIHGVLVDDNNPFINGYRLVSSLKPITFTLPAATYVAGATVQVTISYNGVTTGDIVSINPSSNTLTAGLVFYATIASSNNIRVIVTNTTASSITEPAHEFKAHAVKG